MISSNKLEGLKIAFEISQNLRKVHTLKTMRR